MTLGNIIVIKVTKKIDNKWLAIIFFPNFFSEQSLCHLLRYVLYFFFVDFLLKQTTDLLFVVNESNLPLSSICLALDWLFLPR